MTQLTKREGLAGMRLEDFKVHLRMIAAADLKREIADARRPYSSLVRSARRLQSRNAIHGDGADCESHNAPYF